MLSGGLASGKTKVRQLLEGRGVTTIDADTIGHSVLASEGPAFAKVASRWRQVVEDGEVNRSSLAKIVFNDAAELAALESITHPYIFDMILAQVEEVDEPIVVEIPFLHHRLGGDWKRIIVDCRDETRFLRATSRGMNEDDVRSRMALQPSRAEWLAAADLVMPNHGSVEDLREAVIERLSVIL